MKLTNPRIPARFLRVIPEGMKFVKRNEGDYLVVESVCCASGHELTVDSVKIHGEPSIAFHMKIGASEGLIFVDAFWGGHAKLYGFLPESDSDMIGIASCPTCKRRMNIQMKCEQEGCASTQAIQFMMPDGMSKISVCAKLGCPGHRIDIREDQSQEISDEVSAINFFGGHEEDIFEGV